MKYLSSMILVAFLATFSLAQTTQPVECKAIYEIRAYGATGDGKMLDTKPIQSAIDQCTTNGGGTVMVPAGQYLTGTLYLKSNVTLHLAAGAVILGSPNIADYTTDTDRTMYAGEPYMNRCLVFAKDASNIAIEGRGMIDGQGKSFPNADDQRRNRPKLMRLLNCTNVRIRDIKMLAPASWTTELRYCDDMVVDGVTIFARANINGDGLDFDGCTKIRVSNCTFDTSDDSICLQTSRADKPCRDVVITNCNFSSRWAGIRIGLLSRGDFENVLVTNCTFSNHNDSGLKIQMNEGGEMKNMVFSNLVMTNVPRPVFMTFCQKNAWVDAGRELPPMKRMGSMQFNNIVVDSSGITGPAAKTCGFQITGVPEHAIENLTFSDIHATFPGGGTAEDAKSVLVELTPEVLRAGWPEYSRFGGTVPSFGFYARHINGLTLRNVTLKTAGSDARPPVVFVNVNGAKVSDSPEPDKR